MAEMVFFDGHVLYNDDMMKYAELKELILRLSADEIINLSREVGYPVFTRRCMGELGRKFVLLQDGAAAIIVNIRGEILLQNRSDDGRWGLPGGCQELGERFQDTVIREVKEETNLDVFEEDLKLIDVVSGMSRKDMYPNGDIVINNTVLYLIKKYSGEMKCDSESNELRFFGLEYLPKNLCDVDLIETYKKFVRSKNNKNF